MFQNTGELSRLLTFSLPRDIPSLFRRLFNFVSEFIKAVDFITATNPEDLSLSSIYS